MAENTVQPANNEGSKFVERIENLNDDLASERGEYMVKAKAINEDKKTVLDDAKAAGFTKATIKAIVKARELERKATAAREDLDMSDRETFDSIRHSLGDFAELPLGQAAMDQAAANGTEAQASA